MKTMQDYRALGRIEGAAHAALAMERCVGWPPEAIAEAEEARLRILAERAVQLQVEGATPEQAGSFVEAACLRFAEACAEIALTVEAKVRSDLAVAGAASSPPSGSRKSSRAAKANERKLH